MANYAFLQENYGKTDKDCVAKVKELYKALNLEVLLRTFNRLGTKQNKYESSRTKIGFKPNTPHKFVGYA